MPVILGYNAPCETGKGVTKCREDRTLLPEGLKAPDEWTQLEVVSELQEIGPLPTGGFCAAVFAPGLSFKLGEGWDFSSFGLEREAWPLTHAAVNASSECPAGG